MATLFEQSSDIYVKDRPVGLSERDPDIFKDYAISRDTAISIMPSMEELIADPTFRRDVKQVLGSLTLIDIKVRGEDGAVLVKDPRSPDSCYQEVDFRARSAVREVSNRTQAAYRRLMDSPSSSCETSPRRASSPVYDHTAPTARPQQSHSYHHIPSPTVRPEFYESRIHELESENRELRGRVENLELRSQLERSEQLRKDAMEQLSGAREEISQLGETVAALQAQLKRTEQTLQRTNESLAASVLVNLLLATALQGMGGRNAELQSQLEQLQEQHRALGIHSQAHDLILQRAQELTEATSPADLISKIEGLQQTIDGVRSELPEAPEHDADLPGAVRTLRVAKEEAQQARQSLHRELETLKSQHSDKVAILDRIGVVLDKKGAPHESLPELVNALGIENQRLKQVIAQHVAAQSRLGEILESVGQLTGEQIETVEELHGSVERALQRVEQRAETANRRADSLQERVSALTEELREKQSTHQEEITAKDRAIRLLEKKATHLESELEGEKLLVQERHEQAQKLRREIRDAKRDLIATETRHTQERSELRKNLQSAQSDLSQEKETTRALREEVSSLKQALREQEETHRAEIDPLKKKLREASHINLQQESQISDLTSELRQERRALATAKATGESQAASIETLTKKVATLEKELEAAKQASRESDQRRERELQAQEKAHQGVLQPLRKDVERLEQSVHEQESTIASLRKELERKSEALESAKRVQKEQKETISSLTASVENLKDTLAKATEATRESERLRKQDQESHQELQSHTSGQNADLRRNVASLKKELRTTQAALEEAERQGKSQERTVQRLSKKVETLNHQLEERAAISQKELESLQQETRRLRGLLGEIDSITRQVPIEREATTLADELAELEAASQRPEYAQLPQEVQETIAALLKENRELRSKDLAVQEKVAELQDLEQRLEKQQEESTEVQAALKAEIRELNADLLQARNESYTLGQKQAGLIGTLRETLSRERRATEKDQREKLERIDALEQELRESEQGRRQLTHRLKTQGVELEAQRERADHYEQYSDTLIEKRDELRQTVKDLKRAQELLEQDRDSWKEEAEGLSSAYSQKLQEYRELQDRCSQLQEEVASLRQILAVTFNVDPTLSTAEFREARRSLNDRIQDMTMEIDSLAATVKRVEASKARLTERHEKAKEERLAALEKAAESERLRQQEVEGRLSAEESRDRLSKQLDSAHELTHSQTSKLEENARQIKDLQADNTQLREALDAHQHSAAEQEEILQRAIAEKAEELQKLQEIEEARRLRDLDAQQRQELRAADTSEIMGEIARGMEGAGLKFEEVTGSKMPPWIRQYLESMKTGKLPDRHARTAASEISQLNNTPYPLANLSLFTDFFKVTDHVSGLRGSREFLQLKANNAILAQLNPKTQQEAIRRIKEQNTAIIRGLLNGFFAKVNEVAGENSGLSRFGNIGMQLWIWNTVFHGLSSEFYDGTEAAKSFKKTRVKTIDLANAEKMRTTVHDLHSRFQEMMRPFVTV